MAMAIYLTKMIISFGLLQSELFIEFNLEVTLHPFAYSSHSQSFQSPNKR